MLHASNFTQSKVGAYTTHFSATAAMQEDEMLIEGLDFQAPEQNGKEPLTYTLPSSTVRPYSGLEINQSLIPIQGASHAFEII